MLPSELMGLNESKFKQYNNLIIKKKFISNLIDIKLLEIYRINSKVILQTENQKKRSVETINLGKY